MAVFRVRIDTLAGMKSHLPTLKRKYITDPEYFKKVYKYVFTLGRAEGAKVVGESWNSLLPVRPLTSRPCLVREMGTCLRALISTASPD